MNVEEPGKNAQETAQVEENGPAEKAAEKEVSESPEKAVEAPTKSSENTETVELSSTKPEGSSSEKTGGTDETVTSSVGEEKMEVTVSDIEAVNEEQPKVESKHQMKDNAPASSIEVVEEPATVEEHVPAKEKAPEAEKASEPPENSVKEGAPNSDEVLVTLETPQPLPQEDATKANTEVPSESLTALQDEISAQDESISNEPTVEAHAEVANIVVELSEDAKVNEVSNEEMLVLEQEHNSENLLPSATTPEDKAESQPQLQPHEISVTTEEAMLDSPPTDSSGAIEVTEPQLEDSELQIEEEQPEKKDAKLEVEVTQPTADLEAMAVAPLPTAEVEATEVTANVIELQPDKESTITEMDSEEKATVVVSPEDKTHSEPEANEVELKEAATELATEAQPVVEASVEPEVEAAEPIETTSEPVVLQTQLEESLAEQALLIETSTEPEVVTCAEADVQEAEADAKEEPEIEQEEIATVEAIAEQEATEEVTEEIAMVVESAVEQEIMEEVAEEAEVKEHEETTAEAESETAKIPEIVVELDIDVVQPEQKGTEIVETEEDQPDGDPVEDAPFDSKPEPSESSLLEAAEKLVGEVMNDSIRAYSENSVETGEDLPNERDQPDTATVEEVEAESASGRIEAEIAAESLSEVEASAEDELTKPEAPPSEDQAQAPAAVAEEVFEAKSDPSPDVEAVLGFSAETTNTVAEAVQTIEDDPQPKDIPEASQEENEVIAKSEELPTNEAEDQDQKLVPNLEEAAGVDKETEEKAATEETNLQSAPLTVSEPEEPEKSLQDLGQPLNNPTIITTVESAISLTEEVSTSVTSN